MPDRSEIAILKELTRATCQSADRCAMAARLCAHGYRKVVIDQLCEDRRLLLVDLMRCLLLRGVPVPEVREAVAGGTCSALPVADIEVVWIDVEIAERRLHLVLRRALEDAALSEPVRDLLSLHYLRIKLHHDEFDRLDERSTDVERLPVAGHA